MKLLYAITMFMYFSQNIQIMKELAIIIPHETFAVVNEILYKHKVGEVLFYDIKGRGKAKHEPVVERVAEYGGFHTGRTYVPEFGHRIKLEVSVSDSLAKQIIDDLLGSLSTGSASDGKIFVKDVAEAYDIGTKQSGDVAL
jgi:nitrogen regulatory protein P-II 1